MQSYRWTAELELAKNLTQEALEQLAKLKPSSMSLEMVPELPKEMKSEIDQISEDMILGKLLPTGFPVLSEEAGVVGGNTDEGYRWIIDPLDGTVNFVRGLASCAVSIAFWQNDIPLFGVIGEFPSNKVAWGGAAIGSHQGQHRLQVSNVELREKAILCTGFPSRFDFSPDSLIDFTNQIAVYGKVRMLGSAALSLLAVARGTADVYAEQEIMVWDVAAGLALVQGAGGEISFQSGTTENSLNVHADNSFLSSYHQKHD